MKSYCSIESISQNYVRCELELIPVEESKAVAFAKKETEMIDIPAEMITAVIPTIEEGDIIVVIHNKAAVEQIDYRDDDEKKRRIDLIKRILED